VFAKACFLKKSFLKRFQGGSKGIRDKERKKKKTKEVQHPSLYPTKNTFFPWETIHQHPQMKRKKGFLFFI